MATLVGRARRDSPRGAGAGGFRFFATPADEPRARRASDVLLAAVAFAGVVLTGWITRPPTAFERALIDVVAASPNFLDGVWQLLYDLFALWAVTLALVVAPLRRRGSLVRDQLVAAMLAALVAVVAHRIVEDSWSAVGHSFGGSTPPPHFPALRLGVATACVVTAAPYLSHPARRIGRWLAASAALGVTMLGAATPTGAGGGLFAGVLAAAAVHLVFGSSGGRPGLGEVRAALDELGVRTSTLGGAELQLTGAFVLHGIGDDGQPLTVKVYGRDAHDTQLLAQLWRTVWYRQEGTAPTLSRLQQAEHEAFLSLLARQSGVPTQEVVTAGITKRDDALLVLRVRGEPLVDLPVEALTDEVLRSLWRAVGLLHAAGMAHGQIDPLHLWVDDGRVVLVDLSAATVAATDEQRITDQAQALVTSIVVAGEARGLAVARDELGADGLARVLPYLQMPALSRGLRPQVRRADLDLDDLRERTAELAGVPPTDLQKLRRVTWGSVLQTGLLLVAVTALISGIADLDLDDLANELESATWWMVVVAALVSQTPRVAQAVSTLGACPRRLPLGPVYALQLAISYVNLAIPSAAARIAVNVRFFQRQGVPPSAAVAVGALDGFSGFVVQILLLTTILLFSNASLDLALDPSLSGQQGRLLIVVVLVALGAIGLVAAIRRWRQAVLSKAADLVREARTVLEGLRSPRRLTMLIGGNLAAEVLFATSLGGFAWALGFEIGLGELLLINVSVALLAGLMPVPGGIGVSEGALTIGLTAAGLPESAAFAVAIMYRLASFYLPPVWGWFAFRWLQKAKYL